MTNGFPPRRASAAGICIVALLGSAIVSAQGLQGLYVSRDRFDITVEAGLPPVGGIGLIPLGRLLIGSYGVPNVPFRALDPTTLEPSESPRFLVVAPAKGVTAKDLPGVSGAEGGAAHGEVALDAEVVRFLAPGLYVAHFTYAVDLPGDDRRAGGSVYLRVRTPPLPVVGAVLNAATFKPVVSPGAIVSIFGANLGPQAVSAKLDMFGTYPSTLGDCKVFFDGIAAPLIFLGGTQINAIVPLEVAGKRSVRVAVKYHSQQSQDLAVAVGDTAPGIFTASQDGNGQGAILQTALGNNFDYSVNSAANPVDRGAAIIVYATGAGVWNQSLPAGQVLLIPQGPPQILPRAPVSLTIGGKPAPLIYAGAAPEMAGVIQVNALVPRDVESGPQVLELKVGENSNLPQQRVTVAVR